MIMQLGWRSIWRNHRRTAVILMAIVVGGWSMIVSASVMRGVARQMLEDGVSTMTGHLQVHRGGYRLDPSARRGIPDPRRVEAALDASLPPGARRATRVRVAGIVSNARRSAGLTLVGIDPQAEQGVSFIPTSVTEGRFLGAGDDRYVVAGRALLDEFGTRVGNKLVLMAQGANGEIASRAFEILGSYQSDLQTTEKQFVFLTLPAARRLLGLGEGDSSEVAIVLAGAGQVPAAAAALRQALPEPEYEVLTWKDLLPLVDGIIHIYDALILLWYLVAFIAMGFGIVNTILMAVLERMREFGLLRAMGMKPGAIAREVLTESFYLLVIGLAIGNALALLTVLFVSIRGIDLSFVAGGREFISMPRVIFPLLRFSDVLLANLVIFVLGLVVSTWPAARAGRFTPVEAMRQI